MTVGTGHFLVLSALLVAIGLVGGLARRDGIGVLLSIQVMFAGVAVALAGFTAVASSGAQPRAGLMLALVVGVGGASQGLIGVAVLLLARRRYGPGHVAHRGRHQDGA